MEDVCSWLLLYWFLEFGLWMILLSCHVFKCIYFFSSCISYTSKISIYFFRSEKGTYYALDLGGTNFRVLRVELGGQRSSVLDQDVERQPIPQQLMSGRSEVTKFLTHKFLPILSKLKKFILYWYSLRLICFTWDRIFWIL